MELTQEQQELYEEFASRMTTVINNIFALNGNYATEFAAGIASDSEFSEWLRQIRTAKKGADVRESIYKSIELIANKSESAISNMSENVNSAITAARNATSAIQLSSGELQSLDTSIDNMQQTINDIRSMVSALSGLTVRSELLDYTYNESTGAWTAPNMQIYFSQDENNGQGGFVLKIPKTPKFVPVDVKRVIKGQNGGTDTVVTLPKTRDNNNSLVAQDKITYNPNTGEYSLELVELMSLLNVEAHTVELGSTKPTASLTWDLSGLTPIPTLSLGLVRGLQGLSGENAAITYLDKRPYIRCLWEPDSSKGDPFANGKWFSRSSVIPRVPTNSNAKKIYETASFYDVMAVVFRKSCNPVTGTLKILQIGTAKSKDLFNKGTDDYNNTITVFLRKGDRVFAKYDCPDGKNSFTREVRWLENDMYLIVRTKSDKYDYEWFGNASSPGYDASVDVGVSANDKTKRVESPYTNAIFIGDCWYGKNEEIVNKKVRKKGNGAVMEHHVGNIEGYFQQTDSKSVNLNKDYNQFLLPMAIYGICFEANQSEPSEENLGLASLFNVGFGG